MDPRWQDVFWHRMHNFQAGRDHRPGEVAVSIKIRPTIGWFADEDYRRALELIDKDRPPLDDEPPFALERHETGPEILAFVSVTAAGLSLAAAVINLITSIMKARNERVQEKDHLSVPVEVIVRHIHDEHGFREEKVLRIGGIDAIDETKLGQGLTAALEKLLKDEHSPRTPAEQEAMPPKKKPPKKHAPQKKKT